MRKKDGMFLYPTAGGNLIAAHLLAKNLHLAEGTPEHEAFRQVKILVEEVALQQTANSNAQEQSGKSPGPGKTRDQAQGHSADSPPWPADHQPVGSVYEWVGPDHDMRHTLEARRRDNVLH